MKRRRILLCPCSYLPDGGGVQEICRNLAKELEHLGYDVAIVVNKYPPNLPDFEIIDGIEVRRLDFYYPNRSWSSLLELHRGFHGLISLSNWLRAWRPDLVHIICPSSATLFFWMTKILGTWRLLVTLQGELFMDSNEIYKRSMLAKWGMARILEVADGVTACSTYVLEHAKANYVIKQRCQQIVFNGVDLDEQSVGNAFTPSRDKFILALGRLVWNKGFDDLLRAFKKIVAEHPDCTLVIAGSGDIEDELKQLTLTLGLNERVDFIGWQSRSSIGALFQACQFFVMPTPVEPFGIVCLEAMRAGKAIIAINDGGPPEFVSQGVEGILVPPGDIDALAGAMKTLLLDESLRTKLGNSGKIKVEKFAWPKIATEYAHIYEHLINGPSEYDVIAP